MQDTGGHAHRRQEEAFSHTDPNMGQTSKLPDCLSGPAGPAKPGASKGLILILPPRPTHLGADADICRLFPPNSFITALESSFLSDCFNSHKLLVPPLVTQALGGRGRWGGGARHTGHIQKAYGWFLNQIRSGNCFWTEPDEEMTQVPLLGKQVTVFKPILPTHQPHPRCPWECSSILYHLPRTLCGLR